MSKEELKANLEKMKRAELVEFGRGIEVESPKTGKMIELNSYLCYTTGNTFKSIHKSDLVESILKVLTSVNHRCFGNSIVTEKVLRNATL